MKRSLCRNYFHGNLLLPRYCIFGMIKYSLTGFFNKINRNVFIVIEYFPAAIPRKMIIFSVVDTHLQFVPIGSVQCDGIKIHSPVIISVGNTYRSLIKWCDSIAYKFVSKLKSSNQHLWLKVPSLPFQYYI